MTIISHPMTIPRDLQVIRGCDQVMRGDLIDVTERAQSIAERIQFTSERDPFVTGRFVVITERRVLMDRDVKLSLRRDQDVASHVQTITSSDQSI